MKHLEAGRTLQSKLEIEQAPRCGQTMPMKQIAILIHLHRQGIPVVEWKQLRTEIVYFA